MSVIWPNQAGAFALAQPIIMEFEGFRSKPYLCPADVPTIGYGSTRYPDGRRVTLADKPCSEAEARVWLEHSMRRVWADMQRTGAIKRSPTIHQAAAFLSLAYNIGVGCHDGVKGDFADSTLLDCFNRGDLAGAERQFVAWNKARVGGILQAMRGLTNRRMREQRLFSGK